MKQLLVLGILFSLILTGCVSQKEYETLSNQNTVLSHENDAIKQKALNDANEANKTITNLTAKINTYEMQMELYSEYKKIAIDVDQRSVLLKSKRDMLDKLNITTVNTCREYYDGTKENLCSGSPDLETNLINFYKKYGQTMNITSCVEKADSLLDIQKENIKLCIDWCDKAKARCVAVYGDNALSYSDWVSLYKIPADIALDKSSEETQKYTRALSDLLSTCWG